MKKKDILELKRRLKKDECTFTRMCGCYVNGEKNIILNINKTFLNLEEEEFYKYLEIAKKTLSGTVGNNLLELEFPLDEENVGGRQYSLMELKKSKLKDDALLDNFYKSIIDTYDYTGNFLILIFHDAYDVMTRTTDNSKLDESEEVYEYLLCAICPVSLTKAGLRYFESDNRIGARVRDWVVEPPNVGFVFPAFTERSADINSIMYYTKNAKDTHPELMEEVLGCSSKQTATEQKEVFNNIILNALGGDDEKSNNLFMEIQEGLNEIVDEHNSINGKNAEPIILTNETIQDILADNGIPEEITAKIEKSYTQEFGDTPPVADYLIDSKVLAASEQRKKEKRLERQVEILQNKLEMTKQNVESSSENLQEEEISKNEEPKQEVTLETENLSPLDSANDEIPEEKDSELKIESNSNDDLEAASDLDLEKNSDTNLNSPSSSKIESENHSDQNYDIVVQVKPEKLEQIKSQIIDGKKYLVIPVDDNEHANVNGVSTTL